MPSKRANVKNEKQHKAAGTKGGKAAAKKRAKS
jgi:hypothetical protein